MADVWYQNLEKSFKINKNIDRAFLALTIPPKLIKQSVNFLLQQTVYIFLLGRSWLHHYRGRERVRENTHMHRDCIM